MVQAEHEEQQMNGPAISFRTEGSRFTAVYALPGDGHWRTVSVDGKAITLDSAREAEAIAGHVLCAKLHQQPAVIQEPMRKSLHDLI
jgi:hypothetical protein